MTEKKFTGSYLNSFVSNAFYKEDDESKLLEKQIEVKENEAVYVYSFKENKLLFVKGYDKLLGMKNSEINIKALHDVYESDTVEFFKEFHDRVLLYFHNNNNNIESIGCNSIVKIKGIESPALHGVRVFETDDNGNLVAILARFELEENLKTHDIIQYAIVGDSHEVFFKEAKYNLNYKKRISKREIEMIESFIDKNKSKKIFSKVQLDPAEFVVVLENLITRFGLQTREELIQFAKDNHLIPCQFKS